MVPGSLESRTSPPSSAPHNTDQANSRMNPRRLQPMKRKVQLRAPCPPQAMYSPYRTPQMLVPQIYSSASALQVHKEEETCSFSASTSPAWFQNHLHGDKETELYGARVLENPVCKTNNQGYKYFSNQKSRLAPPT